MTTPTRLLNMEGDIYHNRRQSPRRLFSPTLNNSRSNDTNIDFNSQYQSIKKWFEARVRGLSEEIRNCFKLVQNDSLIDTMRQDEASEEYVYQRVKEIIEEYLSSDREVLVEKMIVQNNQLKNEYAKMEQENLKIIIELKNRIDKLQEQYKQEVRNRELCEDEMQRGKRESEERYHSISQKSMAFQHETEVLRTKNRELEMELSSIRAELTRAQERNREAEQIMQDFGREEYQSKKVIEDLRSQMEFQRRELENRFRLMSEDMTNEHEENLEKLNRTHKEKVEQYKKKILEYKDRVNEKDKEIQGLQRKIEEERNRYKKSIEALEDKLQEQIESNQQTVRALEEENYHRTNEIRSKYEDQLREVQEQLKVLLDQKVARLQDDADEQISQIRKQEMELRELLEEKAMEVERDYVKLDYHEQVVEEKNALLEKLREEIVMKELDYRQEITMKMKELEERLTQDYNAQQRGFKVTLEDYEQQIKEYNETVGRIGQELRLGTEERVALKETIEQLKIKNNDSFETIKEWSSKYQKLKTAYDEEIIRRNDLEKEVRAFHEKWREIKDRLDESRREIDEKTQELENLNNDCLELQNALKEGNKERKRFEREVDGLSKDLTETREALRLLKDENKHLKEESRRQADKLGETLKIESEKYEREASENLSVQTMLKDAENRIDEMRNEIEEYEYQIERLKTKLDQQEKQNAQLAFRIEENREIIQNLSREKLTSERKVDQVMIKTSAFRRNTVAALDAMRTELGELKSLNESNMRNFLKQHELKFYELINRVELVLERKAKAHEKEKEIWNEKLASELRLNSEQMKIKFQSEYSELQEEYERKYMELERQIDYKEEANRKLSEKLNELGKDLERRDLRQVQLEKEFAEIKKEKEEMVSSLEKTKQVLNKETENAHEDLVRVTEEKRILEGRYKSEVDTLRSEMSKMKETYQDLLKKSENRHKELLRTHEEELTNIKRDFQETNSQLEIALKTAQGTEEMLIVKVNKLENKLMKLRKKNDELEKENKEVKETYDKKLELFETRMVEVNKVLEQENEEVARFKNEKMNELDQCFKTIYLLQSDLKIKSDKLASFQSRRDYDNRETEKDMSFKVDRIDKENQDLLEKTIKQSKEIERLNYILSKVSRGGDGKLESTQRVDTQENMQTTPKGANYRPKKVSLKTDKDLNQYEMNNNPFKNDHNEREKSKSMYTERLEHHQYSSVRGGGGESTRKKNV